MSKRTARRRERERARLATPTPETPRRGALPAVLLVLATLAVFAGVLRNGFVSYDDELYVVNNPHVRTGLSAANVAWAFRSMEAANWHPLTWISHMTDVSLFGLAPGGHHAVSLLLHAANVLLVFLLLRGATGKPGPSAAAAALFALHPLRVESVAWIAERKDVLSLFFGLLAVAAWGRWTRTREAGAYAGSLLLFAASLASKGTFVTLPLLLLAADFWPLGRFASDPGERGRRALRLVLEKVPYAVLAAGASALTLSAQRRGGALEALSLAFPVRAENAVVSVVRYLGKTVWPSRLAVFYPYPDSASLAWKAAAAAVLVAAITVIAIRQARRRPWLLAGWAWYVIALLPVIGLVQAGWQAYADRYTYVPSIGLLAAVVWTLADAPRGRLPARVPAAAAVAVCIVLAFLTVRQVATWKDSLTLYERAVAVTGPNETMQIDLGNELARRRRTEEASRHFAEALRISPGSKDALYALGSIAATEGRFPEARSRFAEAVRLHPDFTEARIQIAASYMRERRPAEAAAEAERIVASHPGSAEALYVWGAALDARGLAGPAEEKYRAALAARPDFAEAHQNLGELLETQGKTDAAADEFEAALRANPAFAEAKQSLERLRGRSSPGR